MAPRKKKPASRRPVGRPRIELDPTEVEKLAAMQCTMEEMAAFFGCSVDTLEKNFTDVIKGGREKGKASMKRSLFVLASKGNLGAIIWFGKQYMGQRERADVDMQTGVTIVWDKDLENI